MLLTTDHDGDLPDIDAATLDAILVAEGFGKFAVLNATDDAFMQTANDWQPGTACADFMAAHDSEPYLLEYRENGQQFQAAGRVSLMEVRQAFQAYLAGG